MIFLSIILIIGVITTSTDLVKKKIYNQHLAIGAALCLIAIVYTAIFKHEHVLFHIANGLVAFLIGFFLHRVTLWRGGDAKLFTLYAFLMPTPVFNHLLFPSVVSLFSCSFIAGTAILIPFFIKDIIINRQMIARELSLPSKRQAQFKAIARVVFSSWILLPFYYVARITNTVIILTVSYLFFSWGYNSRKEAEKHYIINFFRKEWIELSIGIIFGFVMRLWLSPNSLSFPALARFLIMITLASGLSTCIFTAIGHLKEYRDRVPFAPLLFAGCMLSYTPFLTRLIHVVVQCNVLMYR